MTITSVEPIRPDFVRNGRKQPMITPPGRSTREPYTRVTTFISCLEDTTNFKKRDERFLAYGLKSNPGWLDGITPDAEDDAAAKRSMNNDIDGFKRDAGIWAKAELGTYLHGIIERINLGRPSGDIPAEHIADVAAYVTAMEPFRKVHVETPCVNDVLRVAGTPDLIVEHEGKRYIADLKTGNVDLAATKNAMQLAVYARSALYNLDTEERTTHGAETTKGLIVHLPAGQGVCSVYWIDLMEGWDCVRVARSIREKRKLKFADLCEPFQYTEPTLEDRIAACGTADEVRALWTPQWTDDLNNLARTHIATLQVAS